MHDTIIVREAPPEGPTRRRVYEPATVGWTLTVELWRLSMADWHTTGTEQLESLAISD